MNTTTTTTPTTVKAAREWLTSQGLKLHAYQDRTGRRYVVSNFRGGRCFDGTRQQLLADLAAGWYRYC